MTLVPKFLEGLRENGAEDVLVVVGGTIPTDDSEELQRQAAQAQEADQAEEHRNDDDPDRTAARPLQAVHGERTPASLGC